MQFENVICQGLNTKMGRFDNCNASQILFLHYVNTHDSIFGLGGTELEPRLVLKVWVVFSRARALNLLSEHLPENQAHHHDPLSNAASKTSCL